MRFGEFTELTCKNQLARLYEDGAFIGKRSVDGKSVLLYQYDSFYVEIHYASHRHTTRRIIISEDTDILDPYLSQIQITFRNQK